MRDSRNSRAGRWARRTRAGLLISILGAFLLIGGVALASAGPLPRDPVGGAQIEIPDEMTVTMADGSTTRLIRDFWSYEDFNLRSRDLAGSAWIDLEPHAAEHIPVRSGVSSVTGHTWRRDGEGGSSQTPVVSYYAEDTGVLPESLSDGAVVASRGDGDVTVTVDVGYIRGIYPDESVALDVRTPSDFRSAWIVEFDFVAAYQQGHTNLTVPLEWYASPLFAVLNSASGWLIGFGGVLVFVGTVYRWRSRARRLDAEQLLEPGWEGLID